MPIFESRMWKITLWPFSLIYGFIIEFRNFFYSSGLFKIHRTQTPIVSIGNISVGGTGKTPVIIFLANELLRVGLKIAVLSRGYGRKSKGLIVVSNGQQIITEHHQSGDEPFLIAQKCPGVIVVVDENRVRGAEFLESTFQPNIILLDDAFQHRKLHRNLDIVLVDTNRFSRNRSLLPAGPYRECTRSLKRADVILQMNRGDISSLGDEKVRNLIEQTTNAFIFNANVEISSLLNWQTKEEIAVSQIETKRLFVVCGIGQPHVFKNMLLKNGAVITHFLALADHFSFEEEDVAKILKTAQNIEFDYFVTTEKDWVKLKGHKLLQGFPILLPKLELQILDSENICRLIRKMVGQSE